MPRFVLLYHDCPPGYIKPSHYDFMLEFDGVLWTWELGKLPTAWSHAQQAAGEMLPAIRLVDHRIEYLDYEGPLTGDRGSVSRVMRGEFELLESSPERLRALLESSQYCGEFQLTATSQRGHWQLELS